MSGGFTAHAPDPAQLHICIALYNHLPVPLPLLAATLTLVDSQGSWVQQLTLGPGPGQQAAASVQQQQKGRVSVGHMQAGEAAVVDDINGLLFTESLGSQQAAASWPVQLHPGRWQLFHAVITPRCVGSVRAEGLLLQLSEHCSVNFLLSSFQPGWPALGHVCIPGGQNPFSVKQGVKQGMWVTKVQHVSALPTVQVGASSISTSLEQVPAGLLCVKISCQHCNCMRAGGDFCKLRVPSVLAPVHIPFVLL